MYESQVALQQHFGDACGAAEIAVDLERRMGVPQIVQSADKSRPPFPRRLPMRPPQRSDHPGIRHKARDCLPHYVLKRRINIHDEAFEVNILCPRIVC